MKKLWIIFLMFFVTLAPSLAEDNGIPAEGELLRQAQDCDKIAGQELAALCFYKAYLVAAPASANAKEAGARIDELDKKVENNIRQLIASAQKIQEDIPASLFLNIAEAQMNLDDQDSAFSTLNDCKQSINFDSGTSAAQVYVKICLLESKGRDFSRAARTAAEIPSDEKNQVYKVMAYRNLIIKLLKDGESSAAKRLVDGIREEEVRSKMQMYLEAGLAEPAGKENPRAYGSELRDAEIKYLIVRSAGVSNLEDDLVESSPREEGREDLIDAKVSADAAVRLSRQLIKIRNFETECNKSREG